MGEGFSRAPNLLEDRYVQLGAVQRHFRKGEEDFLAVLRRGHQGMIEDLVGRQRAGKITRRSLEGQSRSRYRNRKSLQRDLEGIGLEVGDLAIADVSGELERQEADVTTRARPDALALAREFRVFEEQVEVLARVTGGQLWDRILSEALAVWERLDRQFPVGSPNRKTNIDRGLEAFLRELSDRPIERLSRQAAGVAYNEGRRAEIDSSAIEGRTQFVVRSEILDSATCEVCSVFAVDPPVLEIGTPEYFEFFPPALCLGGDQCRGFYVPVAADLVDPEP